MAKFSVGREDDSEGPSSPRPKKQRITFIRPQQELQHQTNEQLVEGEAEEELESEYEEEDEEESECSEDEEEEEDEEEDDQNEAQGTNPVQPSNGVPSKDDRGSAGPSGDGSISVTLTDPDVLDCPICIEPLSIPVFQCENGHVACSSCCMKLGNKCPSCSWPIGYNRCRAIEKVIEAVKISCRNLKYGCKEKVNYCKKHDHEETCLYAPCSCPLPDCDFVGSSKHLYLHFSSKHSNSAKRFWYNCLFPITLEMEQKYLILQEQNEGIIFILNNGIELLGNTVNVCCIGPSSAKKGFSYDLIARNGGSSLRLQSFTESVPGWVEHPPVERFLLVPCDFVGSCGQLKLDLCIWRLLESPAHI